MANLTRWFGIFCMMFLQVVLLDGPKAEPMKAIKGNFQDSIVGKLKEDETQSTNIGKQEKMVPHEASLDRNIRSISNDFLQSQFDQHCKGYQPCTCYYPDHPNVTNFELSTDEITINASGINGTGPGNCEDLQHLGYSLEGFHLVRLNSLRVKAIYCTFNKTNLHNTATKVSRMRRASKDKELSKPKTLRFCGGFGNKSCIFYFPDYPDIKTINFNRSSNNTLNGDNSREGPKNCENLKQIGYNLVGFYLVRLNAIKLKVVYCDFSESSTENKILKTMETVESNVSTLPNNVSMLSKFSKFCNGVGSQPCSCNHPNFRDLLQFELSSDELTRSYSKADGTGPSSCLDLEKLGHKLNGFYMVRFKTRILKTIFCNLKKNDESPNIIKGRKTTTKKKVRHEDKIKMFFSQVIIQTTPTIPVMYEKKEEEKSEIFTESTDDNEIDNNSQRKIKKPSKGLDAQGGNILSGARGLIENWLFRGRRNTFNHGRMSNLLKNNHGKCLAVCKNCTANPAESGAKIIQSHCNLKEKGQRWRVMGCYICNGWNKCLSLPNNGNHEISHTIHNDVNNDTWRQIWEFENPGRILNSNGQCLGVYNDSDAEGGEVEVQKCITTNKGQWWVFMLLDS